MEQELFFACFFLKDIEFSSTISEIGDGAFDSLWLENQTDDYVVANNILLKHQGTNKKVIIPDYIDSIAGGAFTRSEIEQLIIPDHVKYFSESTFTSCEKLEKVILPSNITEIPSKMFFSVSLLQALRFLIV